MTTGQHSNLIALSKYPMGLDTEALFARPKLNMAFIKLNNICNAKCAFCDVWQTPQVDIDSRIDVLGLWRELEALAPQEVNLHGGEAFLSKGFFDLLDGNVGTPISITTNGTVLSEKLLAKSAGPHSLLKKFYISIDHVDPALNAQSRGINWLKLHLYDAMRAIKARNPAAVIIVNHVVSALNFDTIDVFLLKMSELSVDAVNLIPIKDYPLQYLSRENMATYMRKVDNLLASGAVSRNLLMDGTYQIFGQTLEEHKRAEKGMYNGARKTACAIPLTTLFIDGVTGKVYPCDTTMYRANPEQYVMGNVTDTSLHDIWHGERFNAFRKKMYPAITCDCINGCDPANHLR